MEGVFRARVEVHILSNSGGIALVNLNALVVFVLTAAATALVQASKQEFSSVADAEINVDIDRVDQHSRDQGRTDVQVPVLSEVYVVTSKWQE